MSRSITSTSAAVQGGIEAVELSIWVVHNLMCPVVLGIGECCGLLDFVLDGVQSIQVAPAAPHVCIMHLKASAVAGL